MASAAIARQRQSCITRRKVETLGDDVVFQITVVGAFFPDTIGEAIKEELALSGLALEDLQELLKKTEALDTVH